MALSLFFRKTTLLDRAVVAFLFMLVIAAFRITAYRKEGTRVVVEQGGEIVYVAPLKPEGSVAVDGPLGETLLTIQDGQVSVVASPCPHKVCLGMGEIGRSGEILACVPNGILVRIEGEKGVQDSYDLITR